MTEVEQVRQISRLHDEVMKLRNDGDYVLNQPQVDKLVEIFDFFARVAIKSNGKVELVSLSPKEEHGGVTATFIVFDIWGDDIPKYCEVMGYTSAITIDGAEDGICISVTVPNVFVPKPKDKN